MSHSRPLFSASASASASNFASASASNFARVLPPSASWSEPAVPVLPRFAEVAAALPPPLKRPRSTSPSFPACASAAASYPFYAASASIPSSAPPTGADADAPPGRRLHREVERARRGRMGARLNALREALPGPTITGDKVSLLSAAVAWIQGARDKIGELEEKVMAAEREIAVLRGSGVGGGGAEGARGHIMSGVRGSEGGREAGGQVGGNRGAEGAGVGWDGRGQDAGVFWTGAGEVGAGREER